jgi:hypothetical protein
VRELRLSQLCPAQVPEWVSAERKGVVISSSLFVTGLNAMRRHDGIAAVMVQCVRYWLNVIATIFCYKTFNPGLVIAKENQVLGTLNNEAVQIGNLSWFQFSFSRLELRECQIGLRSGEPDIRQNANGEVGS